MIARGEMSVVTALTNLAAMSDYEEQKAKLDLSADIEYYDTTDFALLSAHVGNAQSLRRVGVAGAASDGV